MQERKAQESKKRVVENLVKYAKEYPVFGIVNMENLPATQLQKMRAKLRGNVVFYMTKKRLIKRAIEELKGTKSGIENLSVKGMPAVIFTRESPFRLALILRKSKSKAPIKPGQVAPNDIIVSAGPTSFPPGPIISELSQAGIKTGVEAGKVTIKQDCVVAKEGEKVKPKVADVLARLGILPVEVGLDLVSVYENGIIFNRDVLSVDESTYISNLQRCWSESIALAIEIAYVTEDTVKILISSSHAKAKAIASAGNILVDEAIIKEKDREEEFFEEVREKMRVDEEIKHKLDIIKEGNKNKEEHKKAEKLADELKGKGTLKEN